jgi:hypothetical protein
MQCYAVEEMKHVLFIFFGLNKNADYVFLFMARPDLACAKLLGRLKCRLI